MKNNKKIVTLSLMIFAGFFLSIKISQAATYYVSTPGIDTNSGTEAQPWAHCPGMADWTGSATLASGDTVYFNSSKTFTPSNTAQFLKTVTDGVTYDGATWGGGTKAIFQAQADYTDTKAAINIAHSNVTIKGIDIDGNAKNISGIVTNWPWANANISNIEINNCIVRNTGHSDVFGYGIAIGSTNGYTVSNVKILNSIVHDTLHEGIVLYPSNSPATNQAINAVVSNNTVYNTGKQLASFGVGILVKNYITGAIIERNTLYNNYFGIEFENANVLLNSQTGIIIRQNKIYDNLHWGIYVLGNGANMQSDIYNNLIYDNGKAGQAEGGPIFFTGQNHGSGVWNFYNNTIYGVNVGAASQYGVLVSGSATGTPTIRLKNNIIYTSNKICIEDRKNWFAHSNNLVFRTSGASDAVAYNGSTNYNRTTYTNYETSGKSANPLFVNAFADFHLSAASPAINAGTDMGLIADFDGHLVVGAPDIGAYEYQSGGDTTSPVAPSGLSVN